MTSLTLANNKDLTMDLSCLVSEIWSRYRQRTEDERIGVGNQRRFGR